MSMPTTVKLSNSRELLAAVPYLLGYHPSDALVIACYSEKQLVVTGVTPLPANGSRPDEVALTRRFLEDLKIDDVHLIGYGPAVAVTPMVGLYRERLASWSIRNRQALRVTDGRFFSYTCTNLDCCPAEGQMVPGGATATDAAMVSAGLVALPDRQSLVDQMAPVTGEQREKMLASHGRELERLNGRIDRAVSEADRERLYTELHAEATTLLEAAFSAPRLPDPDTTAALVVALLHTRLRDHGFVLIDERGPAQMRPLLLWLLRHAPDGYVAAPAVLLAYAVWRAGDHAFARIACDRALQDEPAHKLALMLRATICDFGVPASELPPMSRAEMSAGYGDSDFA